MSVQEVSTLPHARDERVDIRDLALATDCYRSVALELLAS
jgi:acetylornithine deacetylase/succinyl-diaminopimelate desuccinylase-like protein